MDSHSQEGSSHPTSNSGWSRPSSFPLKRKAESPRVRVHWLRAVLTALIVVVGAVMMVLADSPPSFLLKWGSNGSGDGQFSSPRGVAVDSAGNVYVADSNNYRIQKFSNTGTFLTKWGSIGSGDGQFVNPRGVAVDSVGNVGSGAA